MRQKGFTSFLILFFILLLIALGAGYLYSKNSGKILFSQSPRPTKSPMAVVSTPTPTPDPTASWKTYKSQSGGYSFKYPESWGAESGQYDVLVWSNPEDIKLSQNLGPGFDQQDYARIDVSVYKIGTITDAGKIDEKTDLASFVTKRLNSSLLSTTNITLDGKPAILAVSKRMVLPEGTPQGTQEKPIQEGSIKSVWTKANAGIISMSYNYQRNYNEADTLPSLFDKVRSTFKFN